MQINLSQRGILSVNGEGSYALENSNIYCPNDNQRKRRNCLVNVNNNFGTGPKINPMHVYYSLGNYLLISCDYDSSTISQTCYDESNIDEYPTISFSYGYQESCKIGLVSWYTNWQCIERRPVYKYKNFVYYL